MNSDGRCRGSAWMKIHDAAVKVMGKGMVSPYMGRTDSARTRGAVVIAMETVVADSRARRPAAVAGAGAIDLTMMRATLTTAAAPTGCT